MNEPRFPGVIVTLGERDYVLPALSLRWLEIHREEIKQVVNDIPFGLALSAISSALRRNYPDLSQDEIDDMIDVSNMPGLWDLVMDTGGLKRRQLQKEQDLSGKTNPVQGASSWDFMQMLQPAPDGQ